jgi:FAD/FMN-containing dehydrogenase
MAMQNINYTIANDDGTATAGGGAEMRDVLEFLQKHGRTFIHVPTYGEKNSQVNLLNSI